MRHKIPYLSSLLIICHQSSRLYGVDKYNLMDISDLIGFGFDLNDTLDGLKVYVHAFNILLYSQINISLWTNFIFTDHLSIWLVNYRSFYSRISNLLVAVILQLLAHINLS